MLATSGPARDVAPDVRPGLRHVRAHGAPELICDTAVRRSNQLPTRATDRGSDHDYPVARSVAPSGRSRAYRATVARARRRLRTDRDTIDRVAGQSRLARRTI